MEFYWCLPRLTKPHGTAIFTAQRSTIGRFSSEAVAGTQGRGRLRLLSRGEQQGFVFCLHLTRLARAACRGPAVLAVRDDRRLDGFAQHKYGVATLAFGTFHG